MLLSKILSLLIYPLSLSLSLLVAALLLRLTGAGRLANLLTVLVTVWLYFCATEFGASQLLAPLEAAYPAFADEELPKADAIVVLGGGVSGETTVASAQRARSPDHGLDAPTVHAVWRGEGRRNPALRHVIVPSA